MGGGSGDLRARSVVGDAVADAQPEGIHTLRAPLARSAISLRKSADHPSAISFGDQPPVDSASAISFGNSPIAWHSIPSSLRSLSISATSDLLSTRAPDVAIPPGRANRDREIPRGAHGPHSNLIKTYEDLMKPPLASIAPNRDMSRADAKSEFSAHVADSGPPRCGAHVSGFKVADGVGGRA